MKRMLQAVLFSGLIAAGSALAQSYEAHGVVKKVDPAKGTVTLKHEAIKSLNWPGMTMDFPVKEKSLISSLKPEQAVKFELQQEKGRYVITHIKSDAHADMPMGSQGGAADAHGHGHGM